MIEITLCTNAKKYFDEPDESGLLFSIDDTELEIIMKIARVNGLDIIIHNPRV